MSISGLNETSKKSVSIKFVSMVIVPFNKAKPFYESALKNSGFNYSMKFEAPVENARRNRNRKVIWFNPRYSLNVKTNIGKVFLKLVRKHFPRSHKLSKIFNLNTIKIGTAQCPT